MRQRLVVERSHYMQVSVVRSVAIGVIVVADAQDIWVVPGAQEQV